MSFWGAQCYQTVTFFLEWRMLHQVVNIFHLLGVLVLQKSSKILLCLYLEMEPGSFPKAALLFLPCVTPPLCYSSHIHSLPWLITVWTCPLELREGHGDLTLILCKEEMGDTETIPCPVAPQDPVQFHMEYSQNNNQKEFYKLLKSFILPKVIKWNPKDFFPYL